MRPSGNVAMASHILNHQQRKRERQTHSLPLLPPRIADSVYPKSFSQKEAAPAGHFTSLPIFLRVQWGRTFKSSTE